MRRVSRESVVAERLLMRARAELHRCGYARWQADRLAMCDEHLMKLEDAKASFEALHRMYCEARDHHTALRGKLRRDYYSFVKAIDQPPDQATGIEAKAAALANVTVGSEHEHARESVLRILDACTDSQLSEKQRADEYCRVHNELREVVLRSKEVGRECLSLAMQALKMQSTPLGRLRFELFQKHRK